MPRRDLMWRREYNREWMRKKRALLPGPSPRTHCKRGHEFTEKNTIVRKNGKHRSCRICFNMRAAEYKKRNPIKTREKWVVYNRKSRLKKQGITEQQIAMAICVQNNKCGICGISFTDTPYVVDHCHASKRFRGLLCNNCNAGIGLLGDNTQSIQKALEYLRRCVCSACGTLHDRDINSAINALHAGVGLTHERVVNTRPKFLDVFQETPGQTNRYHHRSNCGYHYHPIRLIPTNNN